MPKYVVQKGHDAYVYYSTVVEADSPEAASEIAGSHHFDGKWEPNGEAEFDHFDITDVRPFVSVEKR